MTVHALRFRSLTDAELVDQVKSNLQKRKEGGPVGAMADGQLEALVPELLDRFRQKDEMPIEARMLVYLAGVERRVAKALTAGLDARTCRDGSAEWPRWQAAEISHKRADALRKLSGVRS